jgi:hypothetical protein
MVTVGEKVTYEPFKGKEQTRKQCKANGTGREGVTE